MLELGVSRKDDREREIVVVYFLRMRKSGSEDRIYGDSALPA